MSKYSEYYRRFQEDDGSPLRQPERERSKGQSSGRWKEESPPPQRTVHRERSPRQRRSSRSPRRREPSESPSPPRRYASRERSPRDRDELSYRRQRDGEARRSYTEADCYSDRRHRADAGETRKGLGRSLDKKSSRSNSSDSSSSDSDERHSERSRNSERNKMGNDARSDYSRSSRNHSEPVPPPPPSGFRPVAPPPPSVCQTPSLPVPPPPNIAKGPPRPAGPPPSHKPLLPAAGPIRSGGLGIKLNIGKDSAKIVGPALTKPKPKLSDVFNASDSDSDEEMPAEARMKMRNIGRETITSSGPNSFGKTKEGFTDCNRLYEKKLMKAMDDVSNDNRKMKYDKKKK